MLPAMGVLAITVNLTTNGAAGTVNGALFRQIDPQSTGTGIIDPFLRIRAKGTEQGFNNSVNEFTLDDVAKGGQNYNHDLKLSDVPIVQVGDVNYYQFLLDINEPNSSSLLSMREMEIWLKNTAIASFSNPKGTYADLSESGATKAWDLDNGSDDNSVELNYALNSGSGAGDMFAYIPVSALGDDGSKFVYLYSAFGDPSASGAGFEEWAILKSATAVPDAATTVSLLGFVLVGLEGLRRKLWR
jgi:hypothetical protein